MRKTWVLLFSVLGCSVNVKTRNVADYEMLHELAVNATTRDDVELALGSPQGEGSHLIFGEHLDLTFYYGFVGKLTYFPSQKGKLDSGMAFVSYNPNGDLHQLLYFTSRHDGPVLKLGGDLPIREIASSFKIGQTTEAQVLEVLDEPSYRGRRVNPGADLEHATLFYEMSKSETKGAMKERWLLIGLDENGVVQDTAWVSSFPEDLESAADVEPQNLQTFSRLDADGLFSFWRPTAMSTDTVLDPARVNALLRQQPTSISEFTDALGKPTAMGFKAFSEHEPLLLSNWSFMSMEVGERQSKYVPPSLRNDPASMPKSYMVVDLSVARLMVAHTEEGDVKEVLWFSPP